MDDKTLLDAIRTIVREETTQIVDTRLEEKLEPIRADIAAMKEDIEQIREDTGVTREVTNMIGEWTEAAADVLKIKYPI